MKALVAQQVGPFDDLRVGEVPTPDPGPGQVLLRVEAAALNPLDIKLLTSAVPSIPIKFPFVPGLDAAGTVAEVGPDVTDYHPGDPVVAFTMPFFGAVAEYALATVGPQLALRPAAVDAADAASLPVVGLTAYDVLVQLDAAGIRQPDATVLVNGATGGIGSLLVQMLVRTGKRVLATTTASDSDRLREAGVHELIDYTVDDVLTQARQLAPSGVDAVVDLVNAGPALATSAAAVADDGALVSTLGGPDRFDRGVRAFYARSHAAPGILAALLSRVATGDLRPTIGARYPLDDARDAVADLAARRTRGKIVIVP